MAQHNANPPPLPDLDLVFVEGGAFDMGDEKGDLWDACRPIHPVKVDSFYIGKYPVTQRLWQAVMGANPSRFKGAGNPMETVSWNDARRFIQKINNRKDVRDWVKTRKPPGAEFRLPTEAEWEYAARGGRYSQGYLYAGSDKLSQVGWYDDNSDNQTHEVGLLLGNELEIHDMSGNVYEWCDDWFDEKYYEKCKKQGVADNPSGPEVGVDRVIRGGGFLNAPLYWRVAYRFRGGPDDRDNFVGFRLVLPLQGGG